MFDTNWHTVYYCITPTQSSSHKGNNQPHSHIESIFPFHLSSTKANEWSGQSEEVCSQRTLWTDDEHSFHRMS